MSDCLSDLSRTGTLSAPFSWRDAPDLMRRLEAAQNRHDTQDIVTFAGFCDSRDELERHVARYERLTGIAS